jgi:hypothetical protein
MKKITLLVCAAALGFAFCSTASAQDVRVGVGVSIGSGRDGISVRVGVGDRDRGRWDRHDRHDRWDRHDRHDRWDRHDRHDRWDRRPPVVVVPAPCPPVVVAPPRCEPPVVVVHAPIQVTITEVVGYRDERYISGYTKGYQRVWDRHCRDWRMVEVDVPVYSIRQVPITATRVVTANWCTERLCYGYTDSSGCFQRVNR